MSETVERDFEADFFGLTQFEKDEFGFLLCDSTKTNQDIREWLEEKFGFTRKDLQDQIIAQARSKTDGKQIRAEVEKWLDKMGANYEPSDRNKGILLGWLEQRGLAITASNLDLAFYNCAEELDHPALIERSRPLVGQIAPGTSVDDDVMPRKPIRKMTAAEFLENTRSRKFRRKVDGTPIETKIIAEPDRDALRKKVARMSSRDYAEFLANPENKRLIDTMY